eukprot:3855133-Amphidinium_carterae.1
MHRSRVSQQFHSESLDLRTKSQSHVQAASINNLWQRGQPVNHELLFLPPIALATQSELRAHATEM